MRNVRILGAPAAWHDSAVSTLPSIPPGAARLATETLGEGVEQPEATSAIIAEFLARV